MGKPIPISKWHEHILYQYSDMYYYRIPHTLKDMTGSSWGAVETKQSKNPASVIFIFEKYKKGTTDLSLFVRITDSGPGFVTVTSGQITWRGGPSYVKRYEKRGVPVGKANERDPFRWVEREWMDEGELAKNVFQKYAALKKIAVRKLFWHGTKFSNLRSILKQGLLSNGEKVWDAEMPQKGGGYSLASFGGAYLTDNWMTAKSSATTAAGPRKPSLMLGLTFETKSPDAAPDEDDLLPIMARTLGASSAWDLVEPSSPFMYDLRELTGRREILLSELHKYVDYFEAYSWRTLVEDFWGRLIQKHPSLIQVKNNSRSKIDPILYFCLKHLVYHYLEVVWARDKGDQITYLNKLFKEYNDQDSLEKIKKIQNPPAKLRNSFSTLKSAVNLLSKYLKNTANQSGAGRHNVRNMVPITYRGKNRILCVVGILPEEGFFDLVFYYGGNMAPLFLKEFQNFMGWNYRVLDRTGKVLLDQRGN